MLRWLSFNVKGANNLVSDIPENLEAQSGIGYSFKSKNVEDLSQKLGMLLDDRAAVDSMKVKAREHVLANYSWDFISQNLEEFYKKVLQ